jgi:hypothetical protein
MSSNQAPQQQGLDRRISVAVFNTQVVRTILSNNGQKSSNEALITKEPNVSNNSSLKGHYRVARSSSTSSLIPKQVGSNRFVVLQFFCYLFTIMFTFRFFIPSKK